MSPLRQQLAAIMAETAALRAELEAWLAEPLRYQEHAADAVPSRHASVTPWGSAAGQIRARVPA